MSFSIESRAAGTKLFILFRYFLMWTGRAISDSQSYHDYILEKHLITGAQADVWLARNASGHVVFKKYDTSITGVNLQRAVQNHPNIARVLEVFYYSDKYTVVEEYVSGQELLTFVPEGEGLPLHQALPIFRQLASAVQYMHQKGIAHRDLKLENVMIGSDETVKIIDFGLSAEQDDLTAYERGLGTPYTMGPEIIEAMNSDIEPEYVDHRVQDVWSMGIILHYLLTGKMAFQIANNTDRDYRRFISRGESLPDLEEYPNQIKLLFKGMLCVEECERWNMDQVVRCLVMVKVASCSFLDIASLVSLPASPIPQPFNGVVQRRLEPCRDNSVI